MGQTVMLAHSIILPGNAKYLLPLLRSAVNNCEDPLEVELVSNGVKEPELTWIDEFCLANERFRHYWYPTHIPIVHGTMMNILALRCQHKHLMFMDADIFAIGPWNLPKRDCWSSGLPVMYEPKTGFSHSGVRTPDGITLPVTPMCCFPPDDVCPILSAYEWGFQSCDHPERTPTEVSKLVLRYPESRFYDTAKIMGLMLNERHIQCLYHVIPNLVHIGAGSGALLGYHVHGKPKESMILTEEVIRKEHGLPGELAKFWAQWLMHCHGDLKLAPTVIVNDYKLGKCIATMQKKTYQITKENLS